MRGDVDGLDPRFLRGIREFSEQGLVNLDADEVARAAMTRVMRPGWQVAATVIGAALIVSVGLAVASSFAGGGPGGQPAVSPSAAASLTTEPPPTQPTAGPELALTQELAIATARAAAPHAATGRVLVAKAGSAGDLLYAEGGYQIAQGLPQDRWVWVVILATGSGFGAEGSIVVMDFLDGTVYEVVDWIS